jgi:hypothetical protein
MPKTYEPIQTQTVGTAVATVTFSSIPQTYTDLIMIVNAIDNTYDYGGINLTFNSDSGSNYSFTEMYGNGSSIGNERRANVAYIPIAFYISPDTVAGNAIHTINIMNYSNTTTYKSTIGRENSTNATYSGAGLIAGLWRSTAAISTIALTMSGNFAVGSNITLYGIKAA